LSTNNNSPCIECFCLNEKILPKLCKKKNSNEQKEISKLQYNISNITISEIATKISYIILQIINGNKKIDENKVIKIDSNNLTVKKIFVQQNKKCGILQYSNQWIKNRQ
jgi:hypothetical protein